MTSDRSAVTLRRKGRNVGLELLSHLPELLCHAAERGALGMVSREVTDEVAILGFSQQAFEFGVKVFHTPEFTPSEQLKCVHQ